MRMKTRHKIQQRLKEKCISAWSKIGTGRKETHGIQSPRCTCVHRQTSISRHTATAVDRRTYTCRRTYAYVRSHASGGGHLLTYVCKCTSAGRHLQVDVCRCASAGRRLQVYVCRRRGRWCYKVGMSKKKKCEVTVDIYDAPCPCSQNSPQRIHLLKFVLGCLMTVVWAR